MTDVPQPYDPYQHDPYQPADYQHPTAAYGPATRPIPSVKRLQYLYAFQFVFESGNWFLNLLAGSLAWLSVQVVPILGPLVYLGYQYELIDHLHRNRTLPYPDFNFNRFGDYLSRGAPPLVVGLLFGVLMVPLVMVFYVGGVILLPVTMAVMKEANAPDGLIGAVALFIGLLMFAFFFVLIAILSILTGPMSLRAGLSGNIGEGFNFGFVFDFIKRMWLDMLLGYLWLMVVGSLLYILGLMFFCIGAYPAVAWSHLAGTHLTWQLYEIYLTRGGDPIPLPKPKP